jgi:Flp pilus assembly protein TadG
LVLAPAGFLVLMILAAVSVDSAVAYLGQRQLNDAVTAAANDAATAGLSNPAFYGNGKVTLDPSASVAAVCASMAAQGNTSLHDVHLEVGVSGAEIEVEATARIDAVFGRFLPGFGTRKVSALAVADAQQGPARVEVSRPVLAPAHCS